MGNRNRPIGPSTVPGRAHCPSGGGGIMPFSIFVVAGGYSHVCYTKVTTAESPADSLNGILFAQRGVIMPFSLLAVMLGGVAVILYNGRGER